MFLLHFLPFTFEIINECQHCSFWNHFTFQALNMMFVIMMFSFSSQRSLFYLFIFSGLSLLSKIIEAKCKRSGCGCHRLIAQRTSVAIQQLSWRWIFLTFCEKHFLNCSLIQSQCLWTLDSLLHVRSWEVKKPSFKHSAQWISTKMISFIWLYIFLHLRTTPVNQITSLTFVVNFYISLCIQ